jgi:hypothetical protein
LIGGAPSNDRASLVTRIVHIVLLVEGSRETDAERENSDEDGDDDEEEEHAQHFATRKHR